MMHVWMNRWVNEWAKRISKPNRHGYNWLILHLWNHIWVPGCGGMRRSSHRCREKSLWLSCSLGPHLHGEPNPGTTYHGICHLPPSDVMTSTWLFPLSKGRMLRLHWRYQWHQPPVHDQFITQFPESTPRSSPGQHHGTARIYSRDRRKTQKWWGIGAQGSCSFEFNSDCEYFLTLLASL